MSFPVINGTEVFRSPPPGYVVNFDNPERQHVLEHYLVFGLGAPIAFIALVQRLYTKIFISRKGFWIDDAFMTVGWFFSLVTQALMTASIHQRGMCAHSWEMSLDDYQRYLTLSYAAAPMYMLCNGCIKLSLLSTYFQMTVPRSPLRYAVWFVVVIVTACTIIITLMMFFFCSPPLKAFNVRAEGSCKDMASLYIATAAFNIVTDVILFVLPLPTIFKLPVPVVQKVGAAVLFGIGTITVVSSAIRLSYLPSILKSTDPSWDSAPANVWTFVEGNLFVVCGSMPTLRRFFQHYMPRVFGSPSNGSHDGTSSRGYHTTFNEVKVHGTRDIESLEGHGVELGCLPDNGKTRGTVTAGNGGSDDLPDDDHHSQTSILRRREITVE